MASKVNDTECQGHINVRQHKCFLYIFPLQCFMCSQCHANGVLSVWTGNDILITARVRSTREGNVFSLFVSSQRGGVPVFGPRSFLGVP